MLIYLYLYITFFNYLLYKYVVNKIYILLILRSLYLNIAFTLHGIAGNQIVSNEDILIIIEKILNISSRSPELIALGFKKQEELVLIKIIQLL